MSQIPYVGRRFQLVAKLAKTFRVTGWTLIQFDPDGLRYVTTISVRAHWLIAALALVELVYRPHYGVATYSAYVLLFLTLIGFSGYLHCLLRSNRPITWRWLLALNAMDVFLISATVAISNGFSHPFVHLFYYLALAAFAVMFTSFTLSMAWVTMVSVVYSVISLTVGDGVDLEAWDEKTL